MRPVASALVALAVVVAASAWRCHAETTARPSADWVRNAVIYEVYLRSFSTNSSLAELQARLPELKRLGVTVVWLMPVHPTGKEKRKGSLGSPYAVQDYYAINPEFGTLDDFRALVKATHAAGMKIIIDLVINHTAWDNPLIREHPDWYRHDKDGKFVVPANWEDVAHLDYHSEGLRRYMIEMMTYWVRDIGIDGFRCDVASWVPLDFWEDVRVALDKIKPIVMVAEASEPADHLRAFDLTYAWNLRDTLLEVLRKGRPATLIERMLAAEQREYPRGSLRLRFTSNHDQNAWEAAGVEMFGPAIKAAAVLAYALPGVPLIYNGDEVGNATKLPLFEKVTINWSSDPNGMRKFYEELLATRRQFPALCAGSIEFVPTPQAESVVVFTRQTDTDRVLVAVNTRPAEACLRLPVANRVWGNASGEGEEVVLPPFGYVIARVK